jgi:Zn-dependent M28 family amino/carboxypeptidase
MFVFRLGQRYLRVIFLSLGLFLQPLLATPAASHSQFDAEAAMAYTRRAVSFGERPAGSDAIVKLRGWIITTLKPLGGQVQLQSFTAQTPAGPIPMSNIVLKFPGASGKAIVVSGHYDTKRIPMVHFVGANDAGSSTGFLLEFARIAAHMQHPDDLYVVFFDGEEALGNWTDTDSRYGSRALLAKWASEGMLSKIKALINIDMIGDKDLDIANDSNSSDQLRNEVSRIADRLGDARYFRRDAQPIDDDHKPFVDAGVTAIDIIDLDYGPNMAYWHTAEDTTDKLSVHSFQVIGDVVVDLVKDLEKNPER